MSTIPTDVKTLVVKIGTSLLTGPKGFDGRVLEEIVKELAALKRDRRINILDVSSGAIGCGMNILGIKERPKVLPLKQATAAVGQARLMHYYEVMFDQYGDGLHTAQVLLSAADLDDRHRYINVRNTIHTLFELKTVIPILNENDSVTTDEIRFGDNDTSSARIAAKIGADLLIILSDVDGFYDKNPRQFKDAKLISHVPRITDQVEGLADDTQTETSIGGMKTKLTAAKIACASGLVMVIANGNRAGIIHDVLDGKAVATSFGAVSEAMSQRKRWIAFGRSAKGSICVDDGATRALLNQGRSLLPAGITDVIGEFNIGAAVRIQDSKGHEIASGLVNYSSEDIARIKGCKSAQIKAILGRKDFDEVIHRDNLVLL